MRPMTEDEVLQLYSERAAVWFFNRQGDPKAPHAELTSGRCSDGYVNSAPVLCDPAVALRLAWQHAVRLFQRNIYPAWVVGSAYAAITYSYHLATIMGAKHGFTEKDPKDPKRMIWSRFVIPEGASVMQCEELITTLQTTNEVKQAVREGNPNPVKFFSEVVTVVHRPVALPVDTNRVILPLVERAVKSWAPEECPLCAQGSPRLKPKHHWAELTGKT